MTWDKFAYIKELRGRTDLTPSEFRLLVTVWSYTDAEGRHAHPGASRLARDLGHNGRRQVVRMMQSLITKGYLEVEVAGGAPREGVRRASAYALAIPATDGAPVTSQTTDGAVVTSTGDVATTITDGAVVTPSDHSNHHQSDVGSGEASAPPPSQSLFTWGDYSEACQKRGLAPSRMTWIRTSGAFPTDLDMDHDQRAELKDRLLEDALSRSQPAASATDNWMNRTSHGRHDVVTPSGVLSEEDEWDV